ncbi:MAG TPA: hypothetical protein VFH58_10850 [Acidimicrobiales bacterium]|nr:hypothetical protein [Acidimicrobiales bacterium]
MRNPHAGEPFDTPDDEISRALLDVSIPTLMLSLVHMSGNPELIRGGLRPGGLFLNEVQGYMAQPSIRHSHFKNAYGEIHTLSPWRLVDYWSWTKEPDLEEFVITPRG